MTRPSHGLLKQVQANLQQVQQRMALAAARSGRSSESVRLVAVTKYAPLDAVSGLIACGHRVLGENRPQQLLERAELLRSANDSSPLEWHLIGPLQSNKVRSLLPAVTMIHSVDSLKLIERIANISSELQLQPQLLLQVNISGEDSKGGFFPDQLRSSWQCIAGMTGIHIVGCMTMAPLTDDEKVLRSTFGGLRELRDELKSSTHPLPELSMGMSHDFEIAIEEGATLVRIGSSLFEGCM